VSVVVYCVKVGNGEYRSEHVNKLYRMVTENLSTDVKGKFVCITDNSAGLDEGIAVIQSDPNLVFLGWWAKMQLFNQEHDDAEQCFYFDLDTVITGDLDEFLEYRGRFGILKDVYRTSSTNGRDNTALQSSVMSWAPDFGWNEIYAPWLREGFPHVRGGDQAWIEECAQNGFIKDYDLLDKLFPGQLVSYKRDCIAGLPTDARVVFFHGEPRPWNATDTWVTEIYHHDRKLSTEIKLKYNEDFYRIARNIRANSRNEYVDRWLKMTDAPLTTGEVALIGGGPSLVDQKEMIKGLHERGVQIVTMNGSSKWLQDECGIAPDATIILDARAENKRFVDDSHAETFYLASQCHSDLFLVANAKSNVVLWHAESAMQDGGALLPKPTPEHCVIAAGSTVGLAAMAIAYAEGAGRIHLFGYDSCYAAGTHRHHAYKQPENDYDRVITAKAGDREFLTTAWMAAQATEYQNIASQLVNAGVEIVAHGDGMIQHLTHLMCQVEEDGSLVKRGDWWFPRADTECVAVSAKQQQSIEDVLAFASRRGTVVQAGGNVGIWANYLADHFEQVITFEPAADNYVCLLRNTENKTNVSAWKAALGERIARCELDRDEKNCGAHQVVEDKDGHIDVMTIDALSLSQCDAIILDIEGYELFALKGAEQTIHKHRPLIVCEQKGLGERYGAPDIALCKYLSDLGYRMASTTGRDAIYVPVASEAEPQKELNSNG
jgi:FkbM family methyltransferase